MCPPFPLPIVGIAAFQRENSVAPRLRLRAWLPAEFGVGFLSDHISSHLQRALWRLLLY